MTRRGAFGLLGVLVVGLLGLASGTAVGAQDAEATGQVIDFELLPPELTVEVGDTITWTNNGDRPHTVTDRGGMFDTNPILPGATASVTVDVPGSYEIFCRINPSSMNAKLVVEPGAEPPAAVRVEALDELREGESQRFEPAELEVVAGTQLILANVGGLPHSLRTTDGVYRIPVIEPGAEQGRFAGGNSSVVLAKPGEYEFFCDIHPATMRGTVAVTGDEVDGDRAPPTTGRAPPDRAEGGADGEADIVDFAFEPTEVPAEPGATITWTNTGRQRHTVTFDEAELDTGPIEPGQSASLEASADPGTYSYFCAIHPGMRGALLVRAPDVEVDPPPTPDDPVNGTPFAYALAVVLVGTGVGGVVLALRR